MAKKPTRRQRLRNRVGNTPADSVQAGIRGDIQRLQRLALQQMPAPLSGVPKYTPLNAAKYGATGADIQFGEVIRELQRSISQQQAQAPINLQHTQELFGGAQRSFEAAKANNMQSADAAVAAQTAADAAIAQSMGGDASEAAAAMAQTAQGNQSYLRGLKVANESFDARNVAESVRQGANAQSMQANMDATRLSELQGDLGDKQVQRGLAATELEAQARETNFQRAMSRLEATMNVRNFNRQGRESRFAQLSSLPALKLSALMAGAQLTGAEADTLNALDYAPNSGSGGGGSSTPRLSNGMTPGQYAQYLRGLGKDKAAANKEVRGRRSKYYEDLVNSVSQTVVTGQDADGNDLHGRRVKTADQGVAEAIRLARSRGLDVRKPQIQKMIVDGLITAQPGWNENRVAARVLNAISPVKYGSSKVKPKNRRKSGR